MSVLSRWFVVALAGMISLGLAIAVPNMTTANDELPDWDRLVVFCGDRDVAYQLIGSAPSFEDFDLPGGFFRSAYRMWNRGANEVWSKFGSDIFEDEIKRERASSLAGATGLKDACRHHGGALGFYVFRAGASIHLIHGGPRYLPTGLHWCTDYGTVSKLST